MTKPITILRFGNAAGSRKEQIERPVVFIVCHLQADCCLGLCALDYFNSCFVVVSNLSIRGDAQTSSDGFGCVIGYCVSQLDITAAVDKIGGRRYNMVYIYL